MKVTFVGHASILIETRGISILSDPWWDAPCFGAQWWNYPRAASSVVEGRHLDYIYVSHGHHDHLHPGTLNKLDKSARVLIAEGTDMAPSLAELGFAVVELAPGKELDLGSEVKVRIWPTHADDSLLALSDGDEVCLNLNDALHSAPADVQARFVAELRALYPSIDYVFGGYGVASHFPNCYRIPGKDREATAAARQRYFNEQWAGLMARLAPKFAMPFAADVVLLQDELFWANEPTHNTERPTQTLATLFPEFRGQAFDVAPGFAIEDGRVVRNETRRPTVAADLRREMADEIVRANRVGSADLGKIDAIRAVLEDNIERCRDYLSSWPGDYRIGLRFAGTVAGIAVEKVDGRIAVRTLEDASRGEFDLVFTTRAQYLLASLTRKYGDETIFVGSGGLFDFKDRAHAATNLQRELAVMIRRHDVPPRRRPIPSPGVKLAKKLLKGALGRREAKDLYDLESWTIWTSDAARASKA